MKILTSLEIKWGILFFLFSLLWMVFEKSMGWHDVHIDQHASMSALFAIPAISIYVFAMLEKRKKQLNNIMTWQQGFICGLMVTVIVMVLSPLAQFITSRFISPDFFNNIINYSVETLGKNREEMEKTFNLNSYILQGMLGALIMGIVTSAIIALFIKRVPFVKPEQENGSVTR